MLLDAPLRFEPFLRPMVWGGRLLERLGKALPTAEAYGESWELSDHPVARSVVAEGPLIGTPLHELLERAPQALLGPAAQTHRVFPWLFKFLDAHDWLSVQVHPDARAVTRLWPGEGPKNEAWFILATMPDSWIYAGLLPGVGPRELTDALSAGRVAECLHRFQPRPGDFLYLPAGTVHAVGGGVLLAEIQQTSDATFRLFDWNRRDAQGKSRALHVTESLACIDWRRGPTQPVQVANFGDREQRRVPLVQTPYFHVDFVAATTPFALGGQDQLQAFCVFSGGARWATGTELRPGQVWLLPAALDQTLCYPNPMLEGMLCTLP